MAHGGRHQQSRQRTVDVTPERPIAATHAVTYMRGGVGLRVLLGLIAFVLLATAGIGWHDFSRFAGAPLAVPAAGTSVVIDRGATFKQIVQTLRARKLSAAPRWYWRALAWRMHVTDVLHAGEYAIKPGVTPRQLLGDLATGHVIQHRFTIVEGWRFDELLAALRADPRLRHVTSGLSDADVMQRLGAAGEHPEGRFLPETYAFVRGDSDLDILKRAHRALGNLLETAWPKRAPDLPLNSPYAALILASIVEKETAQASERTRIAGVFERRLKIGMLLQTDPTVIYGMGDQYHGNIRRKDLTTDTPYNTYTRAGLPPTPIALPGRASILAVLHPSKGDALYFVARGDGTHQFSASLREQNAAVAKYQLRHHQ